MTSSPPTYPGLPDPRAGYLLAVHVAALFEEADRERPGVALQGISPVTVLAAVRKSKPGGRYASRPMRLPSGYIGGDPVKGGGAPFWAPGEGETLADVEGGLVAWRKGMPGRGVGGGRPRKSDAPGGPR